MTVGRRATRGLVVADQILRNMLMGVPWIAKWRQSSSRTARIPGEMRDDHLFRYAYDPYRMVVDILGEDGVAGRDIGEIGPGDHISSALLFLGSGAARYVAFDRFPADVGSKNAKRLYLALCEDMEKRKPDISRGLKNRGIDPVRFPENYRDIAIHEACAIEEVPDDGEQILDVIYSYNVVEHLYDIDRFSINSYRLLRPGGTGIHRVDFAAHDVLLERMGALEWLRIDPFVWDLMGSNRGLPNRKRFHEIRLSLERAGFLLESSIIERYPEDLVHAVRPGLSRPFRDMPVESLCVKTAILTCRKQGHA